MALIIEDGTGVAGANSYSDFPAIRAYGTARGVALSADDCVLEQQIIKAMDYLENLRARYQGSKTDATNPLQWPRKDVQIDCVDILDNVIPVELTNTLAQLVVEQVNGLDLTPTIEAKAGVVKKEVVGPLETEFFEGTGTSSGQPSLTRVDSMLEPLFHACGLKGILRTLRI